MPQDGSTRISVPISVLFHKLLAALEPYRCVNEPVVMRKRRASRALAIRAVTVYCELIDACHAEFDTSAVAAN